MKVFQKIRSLDNEEMFERKLANKIGKDNLVTFEDDDSITVTEKIDGSNAQVKHIGNELFVYSHKKQLDANNTLNGFYNFVMDNKARLLDLIPNNYSFFGEWLTPHHLVYPQEAYHKWYLFDAFRFDSDNSDKGIYLGISSILGKMNSFTLVNSFIFKDSEKQYSGFMGTFDGLKDVLTVPIYSYNFHASSLNQIDDIRQTLSNHSLLGAKDNEEEGIVVTNNDKIVDIDEFTKGPIRVKAVNAAFKEVRHSKKPLEAGEKSALNWANKYITEPRVRKYILELMDENVIKGDLSFDMLRDGTASNIASIVFADALSESQETPLALTPASSSYTKNVKRVRKMANKLVNKVIAVAVKTGSL